MTVSTTGNMTESKEDEDYHQNGPTSKKRSDNSLLFLNNFSHTLFSDIKKLYLFMFIINLCLIIDVSIGTSS